MVNILGVNVNKVTMEEALSRSESFFDNKPHLVFTPNPEIILECEKDSELTGIINSADLLLPDGIGVVLASKILGEKMYERVSGYDFLCGLFEKYKDKKFYLLGSKPGVAKTAMDNLRKKGVNVVGCHDGYFKDDLEVVADIKEKAPDILAVCLGAPKQEKWIFKHKDELGVPISVCGGGSLDVLAGTVKRAPEIYQKLCIEWLYRMVKEPKKRIPRILKLPVFVKDVVIKGRKYTKDK